MKKLLSIIIALMAMITFTSCEKEALDGDWESMKWEKTSYPTEKYQKGTYYTVPKEGGTYTFKCKNYAGLWLCNVLEVVAGYGTNKETYYSPEDDNPKKLDCEVAKVSVEKNVVTITIAPVSEHTSRKIYLNVTAGDIFYDFRFLQ